MPRTTEANGFTVPPVVAREVERIAKADRRSQTAVFRDMMQVYKDFRRKQREEEEDRWVMDLIREAQEEQEKNPMTPEEMVKEFEELAHEFSAKAKERGIRTAKDIDRIIHETRKRQAAN
jgi:hypothetical protein